MATAAEFVTAFREEFWASPWQVTVGSSDGDPAVSVIVERPWGGQTVGQRVVISPEVLANINRAECYVQAALVRHAWEAYCAEHPP